MKKILIPIDSANPEIKVQPFSHNGEKKFVPLGKVTTVPDWVIDLNPAYAQYEVVEKKTKK